MCFTEPFSPNIKHTYIWQNLPGLFLSWSALASPFSKNDLDLVTFIKPAAGCSSSTKCQTMFHLLWIFKGSNISLTHAISERLLKLDAGQDVETGLIVDNDHADGQTVGCTLFFESLFPEEVTADNIYAILCLKRQRDTIGWEMMGMIRKDGRLKGPTRFEHLILHPKTDPSTHLCPKRRRTNAVPLCPFGSMTDHLHVPYGSRRNIKQYRRNIYNITTKAPVWSF